MIHAINPLKFFLIDEKLPPLNNSQTCFNLSYPTPNKGPLRQFPKILNSEPTSIHLDVSAHAYEDQCLASFCPSIYYGFVL